VDAVEQSPQLRAREVNETLLDDPGREEVPDLAHHEPRQAALLLGAPLELGAGPATIAR